MAVKKKNKKKRTGIVNKNTQWMLKEQERRRKGQTPKHSQRGKR